MASSLRPIVVKSRGEDGGRNWRLIIVVVETLRLLYLAREYGYDGEKLFRSCGEGAILKCRSGK